MMLFRDKENGAEIDGPYRYRLYRTFGKGPRVCYLGHNASTAAEDSEDATSRLFLSMAKRWGFGSYEAVNMWAYRATDPDELRRVDDPIGPRNLGAIFHACAGADRIVVCCGEPKWRAGREHAWGIIGQINVAHELYALGDGICYARTTAGGFPVHPLYQPKSLVPTVWRRRA